MTTPEKKKRGRQRKSTPETAAKKKLIKGIVKRRAKRLQTGYAAKVRRGIQRRMSPLERQSPQYKRWQQAVFSRDCHRCQLCGRHYRLEAHHVRKWVDYPALRYVVDNGITLCKPCHSNRVTKNEEEYIRLFISMIQEKNKKNE